MDKKQIELSFNQGRYRAALESLEAHSASAWRDTTKLRCLRSMGKNKEALAYANKLHQDLTENTSPYETTLSERNHQRRYIALVFAEFGNAKEACNIMHALVSQSPGLAALHREYAFALTNDGQLDRAEEELKHALIMQPSNANAHAQLARIYCRTGRVQAGFGSYSRAATLEPENADYAARLVYWSNYLSSTTQQSNYQLSRLWANKAFPNNTHGPGKWPTANPDRQLRIGLVSNDFCAHAVSFFVKPLLRGLSDKDFVVTAYSTTTKQDAVTEQIKSLCSVWRESSKLSNSELAAQISADEIDVLIDLNGHTAGNRLPVFAKQNAPIQATWLGYPATTGLKTVALRFTDREADPVGTKDDFYSEKLVRLTSGFLCYEPLKTAPEVAHIPSDEGGLRFGSFNNLAKVSDLTLDIWAAALHAVPDSTLHLKRQQLLNDAPKQHFLQQFNRRGINQDRITLHTANNTIEQHLNEYNKIDIALDTSPYNGTTTTLEALWMGVPVLTLKGNTHASRVSSSILHRLDLDHLAVNNTREFAEAAKRLASDPAKLMKLKSGLRDKVRASPLVDAQQFGRSFGSAIRTEWRKWCEEASQEAAKVATVEAVR